MTVKRDRYGNTIQAARPGICQNVAIGAASVASAPFTQGSIGNYGDGSAAGGSGAPVTPATTQHIRVVATVDCFIALGASPIATVNSPFLPASSVEYFWVMPGEQIAVLQSTSTGTLNVSECV